MFRRLCVNQYRKIYTDSHIEIQNSLKKVIEKEINPHCAKWEKEKKFPAHYVMKVLGDGGYLGISKPVKFGGLGLDYSYSMAASETMGLIDSAGVAMAIGVQTDMATPALAKFGSDKLREEFLRPSITGEYVACVAVSEPAAGSDVANIKTRAVKKDGDYIINGSKLWITSGMQADWCCVLCNTGDGPPHRNKSLICVPLNTPGVTRGRNIEKIGMWTSDTAELFFEDVRVPQTNRIGEENMGFIYQMLQFQEERMFASAVVLYNLKNCIDSTIEYGRSRKIFNKPLLDNQYIHYRLAELKTELECVRSLMHEATAKYVAGEDVTLLASMCKLKMGRLGREIPDSCMQFWGGMGYTSENYCSRMYRITNERIYTALFPFIRIKC